jgi:heme/copper-type cytochrome/quinol oxidase subunit 2
MRGCQIVVLVLLVAFAIVLVVNDVIVVVVVVVVEARRHPVLLRRGKDKGIPGLGVLGHAHQVFRRSGARTHGLAPGPQSAGRSPTRGTVAVAVAVAVVVIVIVIVVVVVVAVVGQPQYCGAGQHHRAPQGGLPPCCRCLLVLCPGW